MKINIELYIKLLIILLFFCTIFGFVSLYLHLEEEFCEKYEKIGLETKVDFKRGCQVFVDLEFIEESQIESYLKMKELEERLNALSQKGDLKRG